jgi:hypothetical protein
MSLIPIPGTTLARDTNTMALINQDKNGLDDYLKKRNLMATRQQEINNMKSDINDLREDITEIKKLVMILIDKGSNG